MEYVVRVEGGSCKGVLVTHHYLEAMKEISRALREGQRVEAKRREANT